MDWYKPLLLCSAIGVTVAAPTATAPGLFSWPQYPALDYATSIVRAEPVTTYAPPFEKLRYIVANQTTTTWASIASPTDSDAPYGNVAWSSQWAGHNISAPPLTTTATATSVATSELIKPTPLPFKIGLNETDSYHFPSDFTYGFSGAALQIEGAVASEGKGPTFLEELIRPVERTFIGGGSPDISILNYYLYKQDIARLAAIGVQSYAFSISWARILPFGLPGSPVNQQAIDHYNDLINTVLAYNMTPEVTLVHFDSPLTLGTNTSFQGWDNPDYVDAFFNYAQIVVTQYGDRVKNWISFNEPTVDVGAFRNWASGYTIVMSHAKVVHWYRNIVGGTGSWSLKFAFPYGLGLPLDPSNATDVEAAQRLMDFQISHIANPLFLGQDIPQSMRSALGSAAPSFTAEELAFAYGTVDFFAFDGYGSTYATSPPGGIEACASDPLSPYYPSCAVTSNVRDGWEVGPVGTNAYQWHQHLRTILRYFDARWPSTGGIFIAETGLAPWDSANRTLDDNRVDMTQSIYFQSLLNEVLKSIHEDGINVSGLIGWCFADNWEWGQYNSRYGVQSVNRTTLERSYKRSIFDFVDFIRAHQE